MLAATTPQPLVQRFPPAIKAGGFMLTVAAVFSVHLLPLAWLLAATNHASPVQPPVLTGVLLQQAASQPAVPAAATPQPVPVQPTPVQPAPAQKTAAQPAAPVKPQQPARPKPKTQKPTIQQPLPAASEPVKTATSTPAAEAKAETTTTAPSAAAPLSEAQPLSANAASANAAPVSAPVLNATAQYNAPPVYPQLSRRLREQGTVLLELTVLANGTVADVIVLSSSGYPRLDQAALTAVQQWRYQPARRGNQSIDYRYRQRVEFSLTQGVN